MKNDNLKKGKIRTLYSREHTTIFSRMGVFLAGPTNPSHHMVEGWRRVVVNALLKNERLNPAMTVVSPEPESGNWETINHPNPQSQLEHVLNEQIPWELQYLNLCDITAFWLPTYWTEETANEFSPNIGPTSR